MKTKEKIYKNITKLYNNFLKRKTSLKLQDNSLGTGGQQGGLVETSQEYEND
jgi:hypothetical protein